VTTSINAKEVRIGDRLRIRSGLELTVTRIDRGLLGRSDFLSFVEDSDEQWLKMPAPPDGEVDLVSRAPHKCRESGPLVGRRTGTDPNRSAPTFNAASHACRALQPDDRATRAIGGRRRPPGPVKQVSRLRT
jgi:hypothetical protein